MARDLAAKSAEKPKSIVAAGGLVLEVLGVEGMASRGDMDAWIIGPGLTVTTLRDPDALYPQSKRWLQGRELSFVIDLRTMKIVFRAQGSFGDNDGASAALQAAIDDILLRLRS